MMKQVRHIEPFTDELCDRASCGHSIEDHSVMPRGCNFLGCFCSEFVRPIEPIENEVDVPAIVLRAAVIIAGCVAILVCAAILGMGLGN